MLNILNAFNRLPHRFGGRIVRNLYYGAYVKVFLDEKKGQAVVSFFGKQAVCNANDLERFVENALRRPAY